MLALFKNMFNWGPLPAPQYDRGDVDQMQDEENEKLRRVKNWIVNTLLGIVKGIGFLVGLTVILLTLSFLSYLREHPLQTPAEEVASNTPANLQFQMGRYVEPMFSNNRQCFGKITEPSVIWFDDQDVNRVEIKSNGDYLFLTVFDWDDNAILEYQLQPNQQLAWLRIAVTNCGGNSYNVFEIPQNLQVINVQHLTSCRTELFVINDIATRQTDLWGNSALEYWTYYYLNITQINGSELGISTFMHDESMDFSINNGETQKVLGDFRGDVMAFTLNNGDMVLLHVAWPDGDPSSAVEPINMNDYYLTTVDDIKFICPE